MSETHESDASASPENDEVDWTVTRQIDLNPRDWLRATFRPKQRRELPEPAPFNLKECVRKLVKMRPGTAGKKNVSWSDLDTPESITPAEARFWLAAMTHPNAYYLTPANLAKELRNRTYDGEVSNTELTDLLAQGDYKYPAETIFALVQLVGHDRFAQLVAAPPIKGREHWMSRIDAEGLAICFGRYIYPYYSADELDAARAAVRKILASIDPLTIEDELPDAYHFAAALGLHEEILKLSSTWTADFMTLHNQIYLRPTPVLFGLESPTLVESEFRRLKLRLWTADDVRGFLACTELAALDLVRDSVIAAAEPNYCQSLLEAFVLVRAPEAAEPMLACSLEAKAPGLAREWLDKNSGNAVAGLLKTAGGRGKLADAALDYLREVKRKGRADVVEEHLRSMDDPTVIARVRREVLDRNDAVVGPFNVESTPEWLKAAIAQSPKTAKKPTWSPPKLLPALTVGDRRLNDEQVEAVILALASTPIEAKHPLLSAVRDNVDPASRDQFVWRLFQAWQEENSPLRGKWALFAIGHIGADALALSDHILASNFTRATHGMNCLRAMGSDDAITQLSVIAQKIQYKGLKPVAEQHITDIATDRGVSRDSLEDRIIPRCGLDEQGNRTLNFGPRAFVASLSPDMTPVVHDSSGKKMTDLPKPGAKDDSLMAKAAVEDWRLLKKQTKQAHKLQSSRLEQAMTSGRRWTLAQFEEYFVRHPVMIRMVQRLIWGAYDDKGNRLDLFRVTEEAEYVNVDDKPKFPTNAESVGIIHPLDMSDAERTAWGEIFSDYKLTAPFPQIGRATYALEAKEAEQDDFERFHGLRIVAPSLIFTLEKLGWLRGAAMDGGRFDEHSRHFPAANVTAVINYEGDVSMGFIDPNEELVIEHCQFVAGFRKPSGYRENLDSILKLGDIPSVVISEVLADLHILRSKAK